MTRMATGFCVAAALGCMATLGAQTPPQTPPSSAMSDKARDISVTGCLAKGADGRYMLNNAKLDTSASSSTASTAAGTSTTAGTTGTTPSPAGTTPSTASGMNAGPSLVLTGSSDSDLEKHVGHKIQVSGKSTWDGSMTRSGTTGTTGSTTATPTTGATTTSADQPRLDVQSVKMISASCS
jgi:hypothetical protein